MKKFMQGNEVCAYGALAGGVRFFGGYPITPSTEIAEIMSRELPRIEGRFIQMEDEIGSMASVIGASIGGLKSMTATSGPGISLMQENIGYAVITETPCLIVNVMRGGPSTGLPTMPSQGDIMQAKWGTHGDHPIITVYPDSVPEIYSETIRCVELSEKYRIPVILLLDEVIGHMREMIDIPPVEKTEIYQRPLPNVPNEWFFPYERNHTNIPPFASFGNGYRYHITGLVHDVDGFPTSKPSQINSFIRRLFRKIENNVDDILKWEEYMLEDAEYLIFAAGCVSRTAKAVIKKLREEHNVKIGLLRPVTIWPFIEKALLKHAAGKKKVFVPEMNMGQMILEVERVLGSSVSILKYDKIDGTMIYPEELTKYILEVI
ncbi:MAG: 2-oxoacid:acceptor oxidoreductase subunit alpha [Candidatus Muiribacteriota bacterium]